MHIHGEVCIEHIAIGLQLFGTFGSRVFFFIIGTIKLFWNISGIIASEIIIEQVSARTFTPLMPGEVPFFNFLINLSSSSLVTFQHGLCFFNFLINLSTSSLVTFQHGLCFWKVDGISLIGGGLFMYFELIPNNIKIISFDPCQVRDLCSKP